MYELIQTQFNCRIVQWNEPTDGGAVYSAIREGVLIVAESLALLISGLQDACPRPLMLLAA